MREAEIETKERRVIVVLKVDIDKHKISKIGTACNTQQGSLKVVKGSNMEVVDNEMQESDIDQHSIKVEPKTKEVTGEA